MVSPCLQSLVAEGTYDDEEVYVDVIEWELTQRWLWMWLVMSETRGLWHRRCCKMENGWRSSKEGDDWALK